MLSFLMLSGCHETMSDKTGGQWLVSVGDSYLTVDELKSALPVGLHGKDSMRFAESYIQNWVENILLYQQALENLPDDGEINRRVEAYRRALTVHSYQEKLVEQELGGQVTDEEIESYYRSHSDKFMATEPYVRGIFMKVSLNAPSLQALRGWLKNITPDHIDQIERYGISHAVDYQSFLQEWHPVSEFSVRMPVKRLDESKLKNRKDIEVTDSLYCYFLHIEERLLPGTILPLEYASGEIKEILINLKRTDFISKMKVDLFRQAMEDKKIIYNRNE